MAGGQDALPLLVQQVHGVVDLLLNRQAPQRFGRQPLDTCQDRPVHARLGGVVADRDLGIEPERPTGELAAPDLVEHAAHGAVEPVDVVGVVEGQQRQGLVLLERNRRAVDRDLQFQLEHLHAVRNRVLAERDRVEVQLHR